MIEYTNSINNGWTVCKEKREGEKDRNSNLEMDRYLCRWEQRLIRSFVRWCCCCCCFSLSLEKRKEDLLVSRRGHSKQKLNFLLFLSFSLSLCCSAIVSFVFRVHSIERRANNGRHRRSRFLFLNYIIHHNVRCFPKYCLHS